MPEALAKEEREYLWQFDERGSFNAVCGYLRSLGVRWYLPGELGEVVPKMKSIPLPRRSFNGKPEKIGGSWLGSMRLVSGQTLEAACRKADALKSYRDVLADEFVS